MSTAVKTASITEESVSPNSAPIVVVGNGPVGMQAVRLLLKKFHHVVLYGDEEIQPYNRVKLTSVLAGQESWQTLESDLSEEHDSFLQKRYGYRVDSVDSTNKTVTDQQGNVQAYSKLILATGSRPHVPNLPGNDKKNIFTLRDSLDLNALIARQVGSRHTVIIGGGLLGLETARAMKRWHTEITVIEHGPRILSRQVDDIAGLLIAESIRKQGIELLLGDGVVEIKGNTKVESLKLRTGKEIPCDTLIFATGIIPNTQLALDTRISVGRGIRVNDQMQTSDPDIYAIGECCEHRDQVYGLVAPGLEQAGVAVHHIFEGESRYQGSIAASRLKVLDKQVLSIGPMGDNATVSYGRTHVYSDHQSGIYRKLLIHRNKLVGVLSLGEWEDASRIQAHAVEQRLIYPWQLIRFRLTGSPWPEQDDPGVIAWPADATVCQCTGVTRGRISEVIQCGAKTCEAISSETGASTVCGSCKPLVAELLATDTPLEKEKSSNTLTVSAIVACIIGVLFLLPTQIPYQDSVQSALQWDWLWRDGFVKQVTGFTILGLFGIGLVLSLRKRWSKFSNLGSFNTWRLVHLFLGVAALITLLAHTGLRIGAGLNAVLMLSFIGLIILGAVNSAAIGQQHRINRSAFKKLRASSFNWHIYLFWPVPALLTFHVLTSYWF